MFHRQAAERLGMLASLRSSEWDEVEVRCGGSTIRYIYKRGPGQARFVPWLVVAPSAILRRLGVEGLGLYAARRYKRDDYIGRFDGHIVGWFRTRQDAIEAPETRRLLRRGRDKLVTVRAPHGAGVRLLDGHGYGPPSIHLCNDPRGSALQPNADLTDAGWLRVIQTRVPAFDMGKSIDANVQSELRFSYGEHYWDLHDLLGRSAEYAIELDD